ncbi:MULTISPECIES: filamentous hemagglutinin [Hydrogenophaga]|uniref:Filamentous hemagglutinin n=1 Tax=Hydrogenophaga intermedia TaxID=65786 RepID=A0A1L1PVV1_HYDIT|nr:MULTISPECIES: filamentous hemagglutinin [Hydrogenophaga]AOS81515.1 hypothetical protein Q5W_22455 [Hydrogenophaga sp. PBC]CDN88741.1 Filamentous hemagglutinin [Hydrogenophaga intermedia]
MKQKHHRVVFKPVRGLPRTVHWAIALALSSPLSSPQAWSQILADPSAPGSQRPTILSVGGGVPLINITTPSAAGVSRNTYRQFDVSSSGAILNNSRTATQTQLGGAVPGNPWLATGPVQPGVGVREGTVGPMFDSTIGSVLPGGGHQVQFMANAPHTSPENFVVDLSRSGRIQP